MTSSKPGGGSFVYVIGPVGSTRVKIGTSNNPEKRLKELQTGNPERLEVLWSTHGGRELESALHGAFAAFRVEGEWFDFADIDPVGAIPHAVHTYANPKRAGQPSAPRPRPRAFERGEGITPERLAAIVRDVVVGVHDPDEEDDEEPVVKPYRVRINRAWEGFSATFYEGLATGHARRSAAGKSGLAAFGGPPAVLLFMLTLPLAVPYGAFLALRTCTRDIWPIRKLPLLALGGFGLWDGFGFDKLIREQVLARLPMQAIETFLRTYFTEPAIVAAWFLGVTGLLTPVLGYTQLLQVKKKEEAQAAKARVKAEKAAKAELPLGPLLDGRLLSRLPPSPLVSDLARTLPRQAPRKNPASASVSAGKGAVRGGGGREL
ncbi:hypothetical protein GCM10010363_60650 [Streptomyces omiyaensis]|nr:hypothetical protein GCM10010363_60650 [Streptomyces omiyaensis]